MTSLSDPLTDFPVLYTGPNEPTSTVSGNMWLKTGVDPVELYEDDGAGTWVLVGTLNSPP